MKKSLLYILTIAALTGCDKFLDIRPKDKFIPTTVTDFENMLNSGTMVNYGDYFWDLMSDDAFLPEGEPGNLYTKQQPHGRLAYTFSNKPYDQGNNDFLWSEGYKRIFYCNTVIDNIMEATEGSDAQRRSIRAEAYLGRAMEHLQLVNVYGRHYDAATAAKDLVFPSPCWRISMLSSKGTPCRKYTIKSSAMPTQRWPTFRKEQADEVPGLQSRWLRLTGPRLPVHG